MFKKSKVFAIITALVLLASLVPLTAQADTGPVLPAITNGSTAVFTVGSDQVTVNGQTFTMDVAPYIDSAGRTMIPVRYLAEVRGATGVQWDPFNQEVTMAYDNGPPQVNLFIGKDAIYYNGGSMPMDTAPVIVPPGRTMLPARYVAQAVGDAVTWNAANRTVTIEGPPASQGPPIPIGKNGGGGNATIGPGTQTGNAL